MSEVEPPPPHGIIGRAKTAEPKTAKPKTTAKANMFKIRKPLSPKPLVPKGPAFSFLNYSAQPALGVGGFGGFGFGVKQIRRIGVSSSQSHLVSVSVCSHSDTNSAPRRHR